MVSHSTRTTTAEQQAPNGDGVIKSFPPPPQLATPTDLRPEEVQAVVEVLNPLIADSYALYVKTKNYHWHLVGSHFRDLHELFDEQASEIFGSLDVLAERVRRIGGTTIRSIEHIRQLQRVPDDNDGFVQPTDMVQRLMHDNRAMAECQRQAIATCESNRDTPTGNVLQELLDHTEKRIWFLYEVSLGGHNLD